MSPSRRSARLAIVTCAVTLTAIALAGPSADASNQPSSGGAAMSTTRSSAVAGGAVIDDITIKVPHGPDLPAYVVRPAGRQAAGSDAGILFLHWLGQIHNDRSEYLAEAVSLADRGVISVLPQGSFPWAADPVGSQADVASVEQQVRAFQAALDRLAAIPAVDQARIGLVGHDYGAMYGALIADADPRVSTMVLETPDALWGNWFAKYWLGYQGEQRAKYLALFKGLDPVEHTARLGDAVLFQWAGRDIYVTAKVQAKYAASSPDAQVQLYPNSDHQLTDQAARDRDAFLAAHLGLGS